MHTIPDKPGIYKLLNKINQKEYIGEAMNMNKRIQRHRYCNKLCIQKAIKKYGWDNFEVEILHYYDDNVTKLTLRALETAFIDFYNSLSPHGYNIILFDISDCIEKAREQRSPFTAEQKKQMSIIAKKNYLGKNGKIIKAKIKEKRKLQDMSHLQKKVRQIDLKTGLTIKIWDSMRSAAVGLNKSKISANDIGAVCRCINKSAFGFGWEFDQSSTISRYPIKKSYPRKFSKETKKRMSISKMGENHPNWGKKHKQSTIYKMKLARKRCPIVSQKPVKQINMKTGEIIKIWDSPTIAAKFFSPKKYARDTIYKVCNNKKKSYRGYKWEFVKE